MKLIDVVANLNSLNSDATIYAAEPWTFDSIAIVEVEPPSGGFPEEAVRQGLKYFLEVSIARDFIEDWESKRSKVHSDTQRCERLIRYAVDDA